MNVLNTVQNNRFFSHSIVILDLTDQTVLTPGGSLYAVKSIDELTKRMKTKRTIERIITRRNGRITVL